MPRSMASIADVSNPSIAAPMCVLPASPILDAVATFTLSALIWPTLPATGEQSVLARWLGPADAGTGYALTIDEAGRPCLRLGNGESVWRLAFPVTVARRRWYRVLASFDAATRNATLHCEPIQPRWGDPPFRPITAKSPIAPGLFRGEATDTPFTIAAHVTSRANGLLRGAGHFNGKIEAPRLHAEAIPPDELDRILLAPLDPAFAACLVAAWDFSKDIPGVAIRDIGPNRLDGRCINLPTRAMTGHLWSGGLP